MLGKKLLTKTFGILNLVFNLTMGKPDLKIVDVAQTAINQFLWNNNPSKIKQHDGGKIKWGG